MESQQNLTRAFFITFALLMGLGAHYLQHNQGGSGLELAPNNVVWMFFAALIGLGLWKITEQKNIIYTRFTIIFLIALLLFFIPLFYPNNQLANHSYARLMGLFAGFLLFVGMQQFQFSRQQIQSLLLFIVLAGLIESCYSLMQNHLSPKDNILGYIVGYYGGAYGVFQQSNVFASFMATTIILSGYLLQQINDKKIQIFLFISALLSIWVITIATSITGYLGMLIALILFSPWAWLRNKKRLAIFFIALAIGVTIATFKWDVSQTRRISSVSIISSKKDSTRLRIELYLNSWQMIKQKPLIGYGYGDFEKEYLVFRAKSLKAGESSDATTLFHHPHNEVLFWAIEGGILPVLAILLLVIAFLALLRTLKLPHALALLALVVPIVLHTQTELPLYASVLHWLVLIVLVFYVSHLSEQTQQQQFEPTFALRSFALLIPLFTTVFMVTNLQAMAQITKFERSKGYDIRPLLDIINPMVFNDGLEFHLSAYRFRMAVKHKNPKEIQAVIERLEGVVKAKPHFTFYLLLATVYATNNQFKQAQATVQYARYLYPKDKPLQDLEKQIIKARTSSAITTK